MKFLTAYAVSSGLLLLQILDSDIYYPQYPLLCSKLSLIIVLLLTNVFLISMKCVLSLQIIDKKNPWRYRL
jgi:hypothetical protein